MAKDPAVLFFIDKWFLSTKEMKAECRGWYLNLILHQFDKKDLPADLEELANLADVRHSEFDKFKQVFEQVLKQKFILNENGRLENEFAREILTSREKFKDKRSSSGKLSYVLKYFRRNFKYKKGFEEFFKDNCVIDFDIKNEQVLKQVFEQTVKLYINVNENVIINKDENGIKEIPLPYSSEKFAKVWAVLCRQKKWKKKSEDALLASAHKLAKYDEPTAIQMMLDAIAGEWQGLFEIKNTGSKPATTEYKQALIEQLGPELTAMIQNGNV